ncbi:MAG: AI-2E family transporter [Pseudomonadota bacterium]
MTDLLRAAQRPLYALGFVALVIACLAFSRDYAVPIAIAVLIWFLINALAGALRRAPGIGPLLPAGLAKALAVLALFGLFALAAQIVADNLAELAAAVPGAAEGESVVLARIEALLARIGIDAHIEPEEAFDLLQYDVLIGWALSTARSLISDASLIFLYVMFLLVDERYYDAKLRALVPDEDRRRSLSTALARISTETRAYLWLMSLISLGVACMTYLATAAVGLPGAGFWGFVAFCLNFVPTIGSILAVVLPVVYALLTLTDPVAMLALAVVLSATQFVAGEVVLPRVMGDRLNLSSVVILLTLVVWGAIWGPAGMFLAIPITVILALVCARFPTTRPIAVLLSKDGRVPEI